MSQRLSAAAVALVLAACATPPPKPAAPPAPIPSPPSSKYYSDDGPPLTVPENLDAIPDAVPRLEPLHRFANRPYTVLGRQYVPATSLRPYRERGTASWYGRKFHGQKTSIGEVYYMFAMTETTELFRTLRTLTAAGLSIIFITHKLNEVMAAADRVTVLRDGQRVATHNARDVTPPDLVRDMVGHDLPERKTASAATRGPVALSVRGLRAGARVCAVSFEAHAGEILGIAGLIGAGRTEQLRTIFGADPKEGGEIFVGGKSKPARITQPADAVHAGIGMVPEDRKQDVPGGAAAGRATVSGAVSSPMGEKGRGR